MAVRIKQRSNPFALPRRRDPALAGEEFDRKKFKHWVENLPIGNVGGTARYLYRGLDRLIYQEMSPAERFEALEVMRQPLHFILDSLAAHYLMDSLPLAEREQMIARLRLDLMIKTIVGYKVILDQLHDQSLTGYLLHKNTRSAALHRVLYYLGCILLHSYQLRRDAPAYVWREMHGIHHYAVANDLHTGNARADPVEGQEKLSVDDLYKQNLLLALSDPHSLLRSEVGKVYSILRKWAPDADLRPLDTKKSAEHSFTINIQMDMAPTCCGSYAQSGVKQGWILVVDKLHQMLQAELAVKPDAIALQTGPGMLSRGLLAKLLQAWTGGGVKRVSRRLSVSGQAVVVCGLDSLYALMGGDPLPGVVEEEPDAADPGFIGDHSFSEEMIDRNAPLEYEPVSAIKDQDESVEGDRYDQMDVAESADGVVQSKIRTEACGILNQSMNGYHLRYVGAGRNLFRVGGLLGMSNSSSGRKDMGWAFGVVRWIKTIKPQLMEFGVELLGGDFKPVVVQCRRGSSKKVDSWGGFLQHLEDGVADLIVPPLYIEADDRLSIIDASTERPITLVNQLELTDTFAQYSFADASSAADGDNSTTTSYGEDEIDATKEFDSIWESLR